MRIALTFWLLLAGAAAHAWGVEYGLRDPEFARVPFAEWRAGAKQTRMNWSVAIAGPTLSTHQRMRLHAQIHIEGNQIEKRRGRGEMVLFIEYRDAAGKTWQEHTALDPDQLPGFEKGGVLIAHYVFLLPGDYSIAFALWDSVSGQHNLISRKTHVGRIDHDPLPDAWTGLPAVEFIPPWDNEDRDAWFLPGIGGTLYLPVKTRRPVQVEVLLNATPSRQSSGSMAALRSNMSVLIPAVKALSNLRLSDGTLDVSMLDLARRKTVFSQKDVHALNWAGMRRFFSESNPGVVNAQSLANEGRMREFFLDELDRGLVAKDGRAHIVIVLSGPALIGEQEPWEHAVATPDADHKLIYIRYRSDSSASFRPPRPRPGMAPTPRPSVIPMALDDLEHAVEPMDARIYDATSAAQFRRILAAVIDQISSF